jgi:hypothetical protein
MTPDASSCSFVSNLILKKINSHKPIDIMITKYIKEKIQIYLI